MDEYDPRLTSWRHTVLVMLLISIAWTGLVAVVTSFLDYCDVHGVSQDVGNLGTVLGGGAALALSLRALRRPRRSTLRRVGWGLVALAPVVFIAAEIARCGCRCVGSTPRDGGAAVLHAAAGYLVISGPIVLVIVALLHALERRLGRAGGSLPQATARE